MIIDTHFHFMAQNDIEGCILSEKQQNEAAAWLAHSLLGTLDERLSALIFHKPGPHPTSEEIKIRLLEEIYGSTSIEGVVLLGLDDIYSESGDKKKSNFVVTANYLADVIEQQKLIGTKKLYLGASVHPYRTDAINELERVANLGAVLIKWIPSSQLIDPSRVSLKPFYNRMAELKMPLLCHSGWEGAITIPKPKKQAHALENPKLLKLALECGVTVIVAHCASPYLPGQPDYVPELAKMFDAAEKEGTHLYADISALLLSPWRAIALRDFLKDCNPDRLLYGSDFPIPTHDLTIEWLNGVKDEKTYAKAKKTHNLLDKDILFKRAIGIPESVFHNTAKVLNLA